MGRLGPFDKRPLNMPCFFLLSFDDVDMLATVSVGDWAASILGELSDECEMEEG